MMRLLLLVSLLYAVSAGSSECRCTTTDAACWPKPSDWRKLNSSVDGVLVQVVPIAAVCHDPSYDENACKLVTANFADPFWRASQPGALQGSNLEMDGDMGCEVGVNRSLPCFQGELPVYAVAARRARHVQKAVQFAAKHNLRLVIKNSGHELTGRNTAAGSLSIWTHNLNNITYEESFKPEGCKRQATSAFKVQAGVLWEDLYLAANQSGKTVVGAQCSSVGASGGFIQGGGHSQISPTFGLAADNILEFEVVTADGELVVANACQNKQIFWALRGGGGGTFGVVVSATHTAHPALESLVFANYIIAAKGSKGFRKFMTHFISLNPSLSNAGWGGFFMLSNQSLIIQYVLPNKNLQVAQDSFKPLLSYVQDSQNLNVVSGEMKVFSSYYEWHRANHCPGDKCGFPSGFPVFEASRLIPRKVVDKSPSKLAQALIQIQDLGYQRVSGYLVAGGKVSEHQNSAVNPAWREALLHILFLRPFAANATSGEKVVMKEELTSTAQILRDLTPGSGAYLNEANPDEPDWAKSFFGSNYRALKAIKNKVDPKGLFVCRHCVGSEDWTEDLNCASA